MPPTLRTLIRGQSRNVVITERDRLIFRELYDRRLLTTDHIQSLTNSKSRTKLNERLKTLFDGNYLDRPPVQEFIFAYKDTRPLVHALGNKGAEYIKETLGFNVPTTVDWTDKNRKIRSSNFFMHTLGVSDFFVALGLSSSSFEKIRLVTQNDIIAQAPGRTSTLPAPLKLPTAFQWLDNKYVERSTVPDGIFALVDSRGDVPKTAFHFLEYDANSMPVVRTSVNQSSVIKKMLGYADVYQRKIHVQRFGYKNFRVLFVTHGADRIQSMIDAYKQHIRALCPPGAFLFADQDDLISTSPLDGVWVNGRGDPIALISHL